MDLKEMTPKTRHGRWMSEEYEPGLVSVIVPTYNRECFLVEAMDSVWVQTYRPIELLVIDDGSTDNTRKVVEKWGREHTGDDRSIMRYYQQANAGASAARNLGLIESRGEYIQFLDSDDLLHPERLERIVHAFEESSCDFVYTGFDGFCSKCGETIQRHVPETGGDPLLLFCQGRLYANTLLTAWRRSLLNKTGPWDESFFCNEDHDYVIRSLLVSRSGTAIQDILASARRGGSTRITDRLNTRKGWECRLCCETRLRNGIESSDLSLAAKKALAIRWYSAGINAYPNYPDIGRRFGEVAESLGCGARGIIGIRLRTIWRAGRYVCAAYLLAVRAKHRLWPRGGSAAHKCQNTKLFRKKRPI